MLLKFNIQNMVYAIVFNKRLFIWKYENKIYFKEHNIVK